MYMCTLEICINDFLSAFIMLTLSLSYTFLLDWQRGQCGAAHEADHQFHVRNFR